MIAYPCDDLSMILPNSFMSDKKFLIHGKPCFTSFATNPNNTKATWCHQIEVFFVLLAFAFCAPVTGEFPSQRPVTWSCDVFFDLGQSVQILLIWDAFTLIMILL